MTSDNPLRWLKFTLSAFSVQLACDYCHRHEYKDNIRLPLDVWFHVGCSVCKNNRALFISSYMLVGAYDQVSIINGHKIAFGYTRKTR